MGQQSNKIQKRRRRLAYLERQKIKAKEAAVTKAPKKKPAAKEESGAVAARWPRAERGVGNADRGNSELRVPRFHDRYLIVDGHSVIFGGRNCASCTTADGSCTGELVKILTEYQDAVAWGGGGLRWEREKMGDDSARAASRSSTRRAPRRRMRRRALVAKYAAKHEITVAHFGPAGGSRPSVRSAGRADLAELLREFIDEARGDLARRLKQHRRKL